MTPTINIQYLTNFPKAIQKIDTIKWVLSQPAAKQTASPSNGTQEIKSDTPPQRRTFVNIRSLGKWRVGMNRPNKNVVIPPSVLPIVATQRAAQSEVTSFSKIAIKTISELPGKTVADIKLATNKPNKDAPSMSCLRQTRNFPGF